MSCDELHAKTIAELKKIATDMGIGNIPELKADIIDTIYNASLVHQPSPVRPGFDSLNVKQLKELAKQRGVPGYYKLTRPQLLSALAASSRPASPVRIATPPRPASPSPVRPGFDSLNVKQLKELAKQRGVPGYYKLTRPQLLSALAASSRPASPVRIATPPRPASPVRQPSPVRPGFDSLNVKQLRELAKQRGVPGYYKLTRPQLLSALAASSRPASPVRIATPPRPASPVRIATPPRPASPVRQPSPVRPASPVRVETPVLFEEQITQPEISQIQDREKYIDDILRDIQVNDTDKYLRTVSAKILRCLGMY